MCTFKTLGDFLRYAEIYTSQFTENDISAKEHYKSAKEPTYPQKSLHIRKRAYISAKEPTYPQKSLHIRKRAYISAKEPTYSEIYTSQFTRAIYP